MTKKEEVEFYIDDSLVCLDEDEYIVNIDGRTIYYREGVWCERYDGEMMPDWSLTWFYEDPDNPEDYFYYEQDPPETAIHNLKRIIWSAYD